MVHEDGGADDGISGVSVVGCFDAGGGGVVVPLLPKFSFRMCFFCRVKGGKIHRFWRPVICRQEHGWGRRVLRGCHANTVPQGLKGILGHKAFRACRGISDCLELHGRKAYKGRKDIRVSLGPR